MSVCTSMFDEVDAFSGFSKDLFVPTPTGDEKILTRGTPEPCEKTHIILSRVY